MRLSVDDFYELTPRQFWNMFDGWQAQKERQSREDWERTRWQLIYFMNTQPLKKAVQMKDLPLPWDKIETPYKDIKKRRIIQARAEMVHGKTF